MSEPRKTSIARAFSAAAAGYDAAALAQRRIAQRVAERAAAPALPAGARAVEIGCGTGLLSELLLARHPQADWLLTDIAPSMAEHCAGRFAGRATVRLMDGEAPDLPPCDLIVSSLAFQWFGDLEAGLSRLAGCLKPGGRLLFATLGDRTFCEWRAAHDELGVDCGTPRFPTAAGLQALWPAGGIGAVREERMAVWHPDGRAFVRGLKDLGARVPRPGHRPLPPGDFRRVLQRFDGGCPATYHVLYGAFVRSGE